MIAIEHKEGGAIYDVPCGKCPECVWKRVSGWAFRLVQETKVSDSSKFITLTYADEHLLGSQYGFANLEKTHIQSYFKGLRKLHGRKNRRIKYYAVGEYGSDTDRPHYHIFMFNARIELIQKAWPYGQVHYGDKRGVCEAAVGYAMKYISKPRRIPENDYDDRNPEFALISKGIGKSYMTPQMVKWHKEDLENRMYLNLKDGKKITMPRYYKDKIYTEEERGQIASAFVQKYSEESVERKNAPQYESQKMAAYKAMHYNQKQNQKI